jgi:site-specific DNA-methyltransferase (adenine-specific)
VWSVAKTVTCERNNLKTQHPATFPDELARDLILCFSKPGDIVLDPMCGSGTTCVVSKQEDRDYIGFEIYDKYVEIAKERIRREIKGKLALENVE